MPMLRPFFSALPPPDADTDLALAHRIQAEIGVGWWPPSELKGETLLTWIWLRRVVQRGWLKGDGVDCRVPWEVV